jgi:hypothetical protein
VSRLCHGASIPEWTAQVPNVSSYPNARNAELVRAADPAVRASASASVKSFGYSNELCRIREAMWSRVEGDYTFDCLRAVGGDLGFER